MLKREWERFKLRAIWSWEGWLYCWRFEKSVIQWFWANIASATLAFILDLSSAERAIVLALGILVLAAELMNTAVEKAVDHTSLERNPLAKAAKDCASGAVALTAIAVGVAWLAILIG